MHAGIQFVFLWMLVCVSIFTCVRTNIGTHSTCEYLTECVYVFLHIKCAFLLVTHVCVYVCLQWCLRGTDSCGVVWWSSPSREGAGG